MLNICFNKKFYNSLKIAKKQGLIEDSEILLIQKEILVEYVEADKYRNIISKNTDITLWYSRSPKELYCLYFIVNKLINKNIEVVGLDKKNIENGYLKYSCSGDVNIEDIPYFMQNRKKLTLEEKNIYSQKYIEILKQKGDLLVEVDGELKLVEIDYYDNEILKFLNYDRWSYIYEAIGEFISLYEIDISDEFILNRLISLEKNNIVEIKFNNNEIYNSKIRKKQIDFTISKELSQNDLKS